MNASIEFTLPHEIWYIVLKFMTGMSRKRLWVVEKGAKEFVCPLMKEWQTFYLSRWINKDLSLLVMSLKIREI